MLIHQKYVNSGYQAQEAFNKMRLFFSSMILVMRMWLMKCVYVVYAHCYVSAKCRLWKEGRSIVGEQSGLIDWAWRGSNQRKRKQHFLVQSWKGRETVWNKLWEEKEYLIVLEDWWWGGVRI